MLKTENVVVGFSYPKQESTNLGSATVCNPTDHWLLGVHARVHGCVEGHHLVVQQACVKGEWAPWWLSSRFPLPS